MLNMGTLIGGNLGVGGWGGGGGEVMGNMTEVNKERKNIRGGAQSLAKF